LLRVIGGFNVKEGLAVANIAGVAIAEYMGLVDGTNTLYEVELT